MSESNVVGIYGDVPVQRAEPNETAINALKDLLERAESGELQGVAVSYLDRDGIASYVIAGRICSFSTIGAVEVMRSILVEGSLDA